MWIGVPYVDYCFSTLFIHIFIILMENITHITFGSSAFYHVVKTYLFILTQFISLFLLPTLIQSFKIRRTSVFNDFFSERALQSNLNIHIHLDRTSFLRSFVRRGEIYHRYFRRGLWISSSHFGSYKENSYPVTEGQKKMSSMYSRKKYGHQSLNVHSKLK